MSLIRSAAVTMTLGFALTMLPAASEGKPWWLKGVESNESDFLPPDVAFRAGCRLEGDHIRVRFSIADGYYLYRQKMQIAAESPGLSLGEASFPSGILKTDPYLGTQEIFVRRVEAQVPYTRSDAGAHPVEIRVTYQGCAEAGLCYPPISKVLFADAGPVATPPVAHPWEGVAIVAGVLAFLWAGSLLRKERELDTPGT